jgi:Na+-driven multidrug efflux pump
MAVFMTCGTALTRVISAEPVHLELVPTLLFIGGLVQPFFSLSMTIRQGLRGVGDTTWVLLITVASTWGIRLPAAWFFGIGLGLGLPGIWIGLCGELVIRGCLYLARFTWGNWTKVEV